MKGNCVGTEDTFVQPTTVLRMHRELMTYETVGILEFCVKTFSYGTVRTTVIKTLHTLPLNRQTYMQYTCSIARAVLGSSDYRHNSETILNDLLCCVKQIVHKKHVIQGFLIVFYLKLKLFVFGFVYQLYVNKQKLPWLPPQYLTDLPISMKHLKTKLRVYIIS